MCWSFEKLFIGLLSSFFFKFRFNILNLSLKSSPNDTKREKNFNGFKFLICLFVLGRDIWLKRLLDGFPVFFLAFFAVISNGKDFSILNFVENIKNYAGSYLKQLNTQLSVI